MRELGTLTRRFGAVVADLGLFGFAAYAETTNETNAARLHHSGNAAVWADPAFVALVAQHRQRHDPAAARTFSHR